MKALVAAVGSDGDIQPFLALSQKLIAEGHEVVFATVEHFANRCARLGIPFTAVGPPRNAAEMKALFGRILAEPKPMRQLVLITESMLEPQLAALPGLVAAMRDVDIVIYPRG